MYIVGICICVIALYGCNNENTTTSQPNDKLPTTTVAPSDPPSFHVYTGTSVEKYRAVLKDKRLTYAGLDRHYETSICPPYAFSVGDQRYRLESVPFAYGSLTSLYLTMSTPSLVLKVQDPPAIEILDGLWREQAAAVALGAHDELFPTFFDTDYRSSRVSDFCQIRIALMSNAGNMSLAKLLEIHGYQSVSLVRAIAVRALTILEAVHTVGLVHGDIHVGNFVFESFATVSSSLKLIDFGRSTEWLDPLTGSHMTLEAAEEKEKIEESDYHNSPSGLNAFLLSPFELSASPRSRRDDLFRLADMLVLMIVGEDRRLARAGSGRQVAKIKQYRNFYGVPKEFADFYQYTLGLDFDQTPDYELISQLFL